MINKTLLNEVKTFKGNVLAIGDIDDKIVKEMNKNDLITELNIISKKTYNMGSGSGHTKKITLKKLRKFKKKRVNYLLVNYDNIGEYLNSFIKDSIYITSDYIYFVTDNKKIEKYYNRYNTNIKTIKCNNKIIYIINTKNAKNNKVKEFIYSVLDKFDKIVDIITNLLLS